MNSVSECVVLWKSIASRHLCQECLLNCWASIRKRRETQRWWGRSLSTMNRDDVDIYVIGWQFCALPSPFLWTSEMSYDFYEMEFFKDDFHFPSVDCENWWKILSRRRGIDWCGDGLWNLFSLTRDGKQLRYIFIFYGS